MTLTAKQPSAAWLASRAKDGRYRIGSHVSPAGGHATRWFVYDIDDVYGTPLCYCGSRETALKHAEQLNGAAS